MPMMRAGILVEMLSFYLRIIWQISQRMGTDEYILKALQMLNQLL
jgi:hypothetical protein